MNERDLESKGFIKQPDGSYAKTWRTVATSGLAPSAKHEPNPLHESLAEDAREAPDQSRRLVRITSFRVRLCDERNLFEKHFVDALVEAGILFDDSPKYCQVEVEQKQVSEKAMERTQITIERLC